MSEQPTLIHSPEAEAAVIGAVLMTPELYHAAVEKLTRPDDFFLLRNRHIWQAFQTLMRAGVQFDYLTVSEELKRAGKLEEVGGTEYLMKLINQTPTTLHASDYAELVRRAAVRRRIMQAADDIKRTVADETIDTSKAVERVEQVIFAALATGVTTRTERVGVTASAYWDRIMEMQRRDDGCLGVPSGWAELDRLTQGAQPGQLIYVAGRPGTGKTQFLLNLARMAAGTYKQPAFFWSGEMSKEQNVMRILSMETGINNQRLQSGEMNEIEVSRFTDAALKRMKDWPLFVDDTGGVTVQTLHSMCRKHAMMHGLKAVFVDYMGLLRAAGKTRTEVVSEISWALKVMAQDLNVPVYAAAQLNRQVEGRANDKRPVLSDLRDSGSLEQDADIVMFLYRDEMYDPATEFPNTMEVIIAKHRNGPTGSVTLYFDKRTGRITGGTQRTVNLSNERKEGR